MLHSAQATDTELRDAVACCDSAVEQCPTYPYSYYIKSRLHMRLHQPRQAAEAAQQCTEAKPDLWSAYFILADALEASDEYEAAVAARSQVPKALRIRLQRAYNSKKQEEHEVIASAAHPLTPGGIGNSIRHAGGVGNAVDPSLHSAGLSGEEAADDGDSVASVSSDTPQLRLGEATQQVVDMRGGGDEHNSVEMHTRYVIHSNSHQDQGKERLLADQPARRIRQTTPLPGAYAGFQPTMGFTPSQRSAAASMVTHAHGFTSDVAISANDPDAYYRKREEEFFDAMRRDSNHKKFRLGQRKMYTHTAAERTKLRQVGEQRERFTRLSAELRK